MSEVRCEDDESALLCAGEEEEGGSSVVIDTTATTKKRKIMNQFDWNSMTVSRVKKVSLAITGVRRCVSTKTHEVTKRGRVSMKVEYDLKSVVESVAQEALEAAGEPGTCACHVARPFIFIVFLLLLLLLVFAQTAGRRGSI
jgi:hypothetical protein